MQNEIKILFICGSLEPGKDGVGDYTRRLAAELIRQGIAARLLAVADKHLNTRTHEEIQEDHATEVHVLRLSRQASWSSRMESAKRYIMGFSPTWLSLQYVPYAFNDKGLPVRFTQGISRLSTNQQWHIMFHELWVGMDMESSIKLRLIGWMQRQLIKRMIARLHPAHVHTNTQIYKKQLERLNANPSLLPLFGNIPVAGGEEKPSYDGISIIVFGSLQPGSDIEAFTAWVNNIKQSTQKKFIVHFVGKNGSELRAWIALLTQKEIDFIVHGEQSSTYISRLFQAGQFGLNTTPWYQSEKSGSIAAMHEHGLPVVCIGRPWTPHRALSNGLDKPQVIAFHEHLTLNEILHKKVISYSLREISGRLINTLTCLIT